MIRDNWYEFDNFIDILKQNYNEQINLRNSRNAHICEELKSWVEEKFPKA